MTLDERRATIERFRRGEVCVLLNCQILTEGADVPEIDCVLLARPTKSRALYLQMCGRGFRLHPDKANTLLLDLVGNSSRLDLMSPASLVGLNSDDVRDGEDLAAAAARKRRRETLVAQQHDVTIRVEHVDLFQKRKAAWVPIGNGCYVLTCGSAGQVRIEPDPEADRHYSLIGCGANSTGVVLEAGLTIDYATGLGEAYAKRLGVDHLIRRDAPWRQRPATEKQLRFLAALGGTPPPGNPTAGEISVLIDLAKAARVSA